MSGDKQEIMDCFAPIFMKLLVGHFIYIQNWHKVTNWRHWIVVWYISTPTGQGGYCKSMYSTMLNKGMYWMLYVQSHPWTVDTIHCPGMGLNLKMTKQWGLVMVKSISPCQWGQSAKSSSTIHSKKMKINAMHFKINLDIFPFVFRKHVLKANMRWQPPIAW